MCLKVVCLLVPDTYWITVAGRRFDFELPPYCGLVVLGENGTPVNGPGARHPFWAAVDLWAEQGRRMTLAGECVWAAKPKPRTERLGGRNYRLLESVAWSRVLEAYVVTPCGD